MSKNSNFVKLGAMILSKEKDAQGRAQYYLKLDEEVEVLINGRKLAGNTIGIERPTDKFDRMLASGRISEKEHAEKSSMFEDGGKASFVKFEFTARVKE